MKQIIRINLILFLVLTIVSGCKMSTKQETKKNQEQEETKIDLSTQENYENFLSDMGITVHEKTSFKELKKTNDGNYKIIYDVEPFENIQDSLQSYYENMFDEILLNDGWQKPKDGWDPHGTLYEKDDNYFKFFILVSEKHNVYELAFKYGQ